MVITFLFFVSVLSNLDINTRKSENKFSSKLSFPCNQIFNSSNCSFVKLDDSMIVDGRIISEAGLENRLLKSLYSDPMQYSLAHILCFPVVVKISPLGLI